MDFSIAICLFIFNFLLYFGCGVMIYWRRQYTCISIRSPILLYFNNIGGFLMTSCLILYLIVKADEKEEHSDVWGYVFSSFYFSQALMMVSFVLRCQRILSCTQIQTDERIDIKRFIDKRYLFQEKFYFKIFCGFFLALLLLVIAANIVSPITLNILMNLNKKKDDYTTTNSYIWLILNVIEQLILVTYAYLMSVNDVKQKIRFELSMFIIVWFVFSNSMLIFDIFGNEEDSMSQIGVFVALFCLYCCLGLNGIFPCVLSYYYKTSIAYTFNPKLMNNLYLFLTNESCYAAFNAFLRYDPKDSYYLKLYTHIMKYKLEFISEENQEVVLNEANNINRIYFTVYNDMLEEAVFDNTKMACQQLSRGIFKNDMFDEALQASFIYLGKRFADFKNTDQFSSLSDSLALNSYIQCKMCNTGLINKF